MTYAQDTAPSRRPEWTLGDRLTKSRKRAGYTQAQMAERIARGLKSVKAYELDRIEPKRATLIAWAFVCEVDLEWLTNGTEEQPAPTTPTGRPVTEPVTNGYLQLAA